MRVKSAFFILLLCQFMGAFLLPPLAAFARMDAVPGSRYTSGRAAALGDAFLPLADDGPSGLFYNPAALAKIRTVRVEPMNFQFQAASDYLLNPGRNFYEATSLEKYAPTLGVHPDTYPGLGGAILPTIAMPGFSAGLLMQSSFSASSDRANIKYRSLYQFVPALGTGFRLASGILRVGYSLQWVNQASGSHVQPIDTKPMGYNQYLKQGSAFSHNLGLALTLPYTYLPAFNLVARNIFGATYRSFTVIHWGQNSTGTPDTEPMSVDASISTLYKAGSGLNINYVLEARDVNNRSQIALIGRLAAGMEIGMRDSFFLRGGWSSGYPSAGVGLKQKRAEFAISWFSEEAGTSYHERRDAKWLVHYQIRAF